MDVKFKKTKLDNVKYEAVAVFDVNNDGMLDIVCGEYWYEGPDFKVKHKICDIRQEGEYYDDFSDFGMDVNGDGNIDIITGGWWGETLLWRENPGNHGEWKTHNIDKCGSIETIRFYDIDGCGIPEIFPNTPNSPQSFYKLIIDEQGRGTGNFKKYTISERNSGHGLGFGDINNDGRIDIILSNGWLEQPEDGPFTGFWTFHSEFDMKMMASVPILCSDVTGNGICDIIAGNAHNYGLYWWEQKKDHNGNRLWEKHTIDETAAQYHDMMLVDIDDDGAPELLTGKRYRAHCGNDPGDNDPVGIYYFKINKGQFEKHIIDFGEAGEHSGLGIYFWYGDLNGDGISKIVAPGKEGLFILEKL